MDASELEGKTRADLLELCRARGLRATGWKRDRMFAALTGGEQPAAKRQVAPSAGTVPAAKRGDGEVAAKAREHRLQRTGACEAVVCKAACPAYEEVGKDDFGWHTCLCGHTQWAHQKTEAQAAPAQAEA